METLRLRPEGGRRAARGHLWIFSNELDRPDPGLAPGDDVRVVDARGRLVGSGTYNPHSLIAVRLHGPGREAPLDRAFLAQGIAAAKALRDRMHGDPGARACRAVYAEGDGLPGIVVDRFDRHLSVQLLTAAADRREAWIVEALEEVFRPESILLRNDARAREEEGLVREVRQGLGTTPERVRFPYHGMTLAADLLGGQKTGFFFDQRENYSLLSAVAKGAETLDAFCYSGAWGLHALTHGAASVTFCDVSETALELARDNATANFPGAACRFEASDVLEYLCGAARSFDLVILDPPAYAKSRKRIPEALKGYLNLNKWGLRAVRPGGFLVTCSCSHHVSPEAFTEMAALAAREAGRRVRVLGVGRQAPDHPWVPAMPETAYLKALLLAVE